jgi:hypothetical protein
MDEHGKKITAHFDKNMLFSQHQHGFRSGKSCTTNMMEYVDILSTSIEQRIAIEVLYIDFSKAFDTVPYTRLKLAAYGINSTTIDWIESFLANRKEKVVMVEHCSTWIRVLNRVPQG